MSADKVVFYCLKCKDLGEDKSNNLINTRFRCPNEDSDPQRQHHVAAVVKLPAGVTWLKIEEFIRKLEKFSPMEWAFGGGGRAGWYSCTRCGILLTMLFLATPGVFAIRNVIIGLVTVYFLYDTLLIATYATFISRFPTHPLRTLVLSLFSFFQTAIAYGVFYRLLASELGRPTCRLEAAYFSVVTIATLGYGDIQPLPGKSVIQLVIISEVAIGLYMLSGLIAVVAAWTNEIPGKKPLPKLEDLGWTPPPKGT